MYCGGCLRDNALVAELRKLGHSVTMVPLYLPLTLEDQNQSGDTPIFFGGISVYLDQKSSFFRNAPRWMHKLLSSRSLLKMAAGSAAKTNPREVGALTISMLRGEEGHQARELDELITWLKNSEKPDVVSLSNLLLVGLARRIKSELGVPVICSLQGEDSFLDALADKYRDEAWKVLAQRAADVDVFVAPSDYFGNLMQQRLKLPAAKVKVVYNGINLDGYDGSCRRSDDKDAVPTLGFFARMCHEKGLDLLVDAYILICRKGTVPKLNLKVGGSCGPLDERFVKKQRKKLKAAKLLGDVEFHPNVTREGKIEFLKSLTVFSVPALYGEAFGLYVIEALAAGVPVVQPRHGAFPEILRACGGGGLICEPNAEALAAGIEELLLNAHRARELAEAGRASVQQKFSAHHMASEMAQLFRHSILAGGRGL
jgi:glycosyltransferase involved in cell wall biosynthesis